MSKLNHTCMHFISVWTSAMKSYTSTSAQKKKWKKERKAHQIWLFYFFGVLHLSLYKREYWITPVAFYVGNFSDIPCILLCGEFLSLTLLVLFLRRNLSDSPCSVLHGEFLLHVPCYFMWRVSLIHPMLFCVGNFSYMPHAILCREFLLHAPCCFM